MRKCIIVPRVDGSCSAYGPDHPRVTNLIFDFVFLNKFCESISSVPSGGTCANPHPETWAAL